MTDERAFILQQLDGQWQKIACALMYKLSRESPVIITHKDLAELQAYMRDGDKHLLTWGHADSVELRIVTLEKARELAAHVESIGGTSKQHT